MILDPDGLRRLVDAHVAYDAATSEAYDEVLFDVVTRVQDAKGLGKADIGALLFWKRLRADTPWVMALNRTPDSVVRQATGAMYVAANNYAADTVVAAGEARSALSVLPGFSSGDADGAHRKCSTSLSESAHPVAMITVAVDGSR